MRARPLGRTGITVSEIGFGAWAIGGAMWGGADDRASLEALARALDLGVTLIDTALVYGQGRSERLVGRAVAGRRDGVCIATKVPPLNMEWPARHDALLEEVFPTRHVVAECERSLKNLRVEAIDLLQLHVWAPAWAARDEWWEALGRLKKAGKIKHIGISVNDHQPETALEVIRRGRCEVVQVIHNVFDQSPEDQLYPLCLEKGIGVLARVPFDEGSLTGKLRKGMRFPQGDFRAGYFAGRRLEQTIERVEALRWVEGPKRTLAQAALGFVLGHPAVSSVIPGMRNVKQVEENVAAAQAGRLRPAERKRLGEHRWSRNFYR
jgi:aryl-alcohol dehydrogenase-like predicted oxidoreductase